MVIGKLKLFNGRPTTAFKVAGPQRLERLNGGGFALPLVYGAFVVVGFCPGMWRFRNANSFVNCESTHPILFPCLRILFVPYAVDHGRVHVAGLQGEKWETAYEEN